MANAPGAVLTDEMDLEHELFRPSVDDFFVKNIAPSLHLNRSEIMSLKDATQGQESCELWHEERYKRITSSLFYLVMDFDPRHDPYPVKILKQMFHVGWGASAEIPYPCQYGLANERPAMKMYLEKMKSEGKPCSATKAGMYVMESNPYLSSSPDFIISSETDLAPTKWLLEVKCYLPQKDKPTLKDLALHYKRCALVSDVSGELHLRKDHRFYYQIQGQLMIAGFQRCDLLVFYRDTISVFVVDADSNFFYGKMLPKLKWFYEKYFIPELVTKRIQRGLNP